MSNEPKYLRVEMPDGSLWDVPVDFIARHRAAHYAYDFEGDIELSLAEDTGPLFDSDDYSIKDWAANSMNWSDVQAVAQKVARPKVAVDYQAGWVNGKKAIVTRLNAESEGNAS